MTVSLNKLGDMKLQAGDRAGALAAYQESLDIARKLAAQDQGNAQAQFDLATSLIKMIMVADPAQVQVMVTEPLAILEKLDREQKLTTPQKVVLDQLRHISELARQNPAVPRSDQLRPGTKRQ